MFKSNQSTTWKRLSFKKSITQWRTFANLKDIFSRIIHFLYCFCKHSATDGSNPEDFFVQYFTTPFIIQPEVDCESTYYTFHRFPFFSFFFIFHFLLLFCLPIIRKACLSCLTRAYLTCSKLWVWLFIKDVMQ